LVSFVQEEEDGQGRKEPGIMWQEEGSAYQEGEEDGNSYEVATRLLNNGGRDDSDLTNDSVDFYTNGSQSERPVGSRTILASDGDVANGFVKNGTSLPYVYETNESGSRKRSSKILPVCGMCGKKFVCVTTMKRHLVTHTGEKPFSCKDCGKQYTQKGNLRVHERTHRNDRPFHCNICQQKFYRKEPMQKHQWRQHGIVHFKSRPTNTSATTATTSPLGIIGAEGVLYNSLIERIKNGNGGIAQNDQRFDEQISEPTSMPPGSSVEEEVPIMVKQLPLELRGNNDIGNFSDDSMSNHSVSRAVTTYLDEDAQSEQPETLNTNTCLENHQNSQHVETNETNKSNHHLETPDSSLAPATLDVRTEQHLEDSSLHLKPIKRKIQLAQDYMKEVKENREREERDNREREGRDSSMGNYSIISDGPHVQTIGRSSAITNINNNLGDMQLSVQIYQEKQDAQSDQNTLEKETDNVEGQCKACGHKCFVSDPYSFRCPSCNVKHTSLPTHIIADPLACIGCLLKFPHKPAMKAHQSSADKERPFRCCICGYDFRQKAHLQKHQWRIHRRKLEPDPSIKEGAAFLQAVDSGLPMPIQEDQTTLTIQDIIDRGVEHEINRGAEHEIDQGLEDEIQKEIQKNFQKPDTSSFQTQDGTKPLDLSPTKMYGNAVSITKWVQQVETARTPIIPDISILKKPRLPSISLFQESQEEHSIAENAQITVKPPQYKIIKPILPDSTNLTIQLLDPAGMKWPTEPLPQQFAIKSKPPAESKRNCSLSPNYKGSNERADNPLLNQVSLSELPSIALPQHLADHANKRPRTDLPRSHSTLPPISSLQKPMSLVRSLPSLLALPSLSYATDLSVKHHGNPSSSPPLNLSSNKNVLHSKNYYSDMPYSLGKNLSLRDL